MFKLTKKTDVVYFNENIQLVTCCLMGDLSLRVNGNYDDQGVMDSKLLFG